MEKNKNRQLIIYAILFLLFYFIPFQNSLISDSLQEAFLLLAEYARDHVLLCLVPAFLIAGAIFIFLDQQSVLRYFGPQAKKWLSYTVASVSGAILAVCSCTVLPIFKGIYKKGAGIGPAVAFLYSGPAINILAILLTARVLGWEIGLARVIGSVLFAIVIGLLMHLLFRKEDAERKTNADMFSYDKKDNSLRNILLMLGLIGFLVFINWGDSDGSSAMWDFIYRSKYWIGGGFALFTIIFSVLKYDKDELKTWMGSTRDFAVQILPYLFIGVFIAGFLMGRPGYSGLIPPEWISGSVGTNSFLSNLIAAVSGALMYFATLTEIPILQGLMGAGMHHGPALALLLAGPSLSLPSMLVIGKELGWKKTIAYIFLVIGLSTAAGMLFGSVKILSTIS